MKKTAKMTLIAVTLMISVFMGIINIFGAGVSGLSGPSSVRAGDNITLTFSVTGNGLLGLTATLDYDVTQMTLLSSKQVIASPWLTETSGNNIIAYDNNQTAPINGTKSIISFFFKVSSSLKQGDKVTVRVKNIVASAGTSDISYADAVYSAVLLGQRSKDSSLASVSMPGIDFSPEFDKGVFYYTASVPFETDRVTVKAVASDKNASVAVSGTRLDVGKNATYIVVTAENGSKTTYTFSIMRAQDPNYEASSVSSLSSIKLSEGRLSPAFDPETTEYAVYLSHGAERITVSGTPTDEKAFPTDDIEAELNDGDNVIPLTCLAEDGVTETTYTIHVYRMREFDGVIPSVDYGDEPVTEEPTPETTPAETEKTPETEPEEKKEEEQKPWFTEPKFLYATVGVSFITLLLGVLIGFLFRKSKK